MEQIETNLTPKQAAAVAALVSNATTEQAAAAAGVGRTTLYRWQSTPAFKAALASAELELIDHSVRRLLALQEKALEALGELMRATAPAPVRLRAALGVLELSTRLRELRNSEQRLAEQEQQIAKLRELYEARR